ncbi:hypothetical protein [Sedimentisphaera cyanobacteriorum]|nr:hypothetical protein [Sedimentisphaera cyanobacteriorum]
MAETPDFGNNWQNAHTFSADGSVVEGSLNTGGDVDWLKFIPSPQYIYAVSCSSIDAGYTDFQIFSANKYNSMIYEITSEESLSSTSFTFYIYCETPAAIYVKVYDNDGDYEISAWADRAFPLDSYSDACSSPHNITLSGQTTVI